MSEWGAKLAAFGSAGWANTTGPDGGWFDTLFDERRLEHIMRRAANRPGDAVHIVFEDAVPPAGYRSMAEWIYRNADSRFRAVRNRVGEVIVKRVELGGSSNLYAMSFVMASLALFVGLGVASLMMHRSNEAQANTVA